MKVLVIVHGYPPAAQGGAEIYARAHARALHALYGDDVCVLAREADETRPEYELRAELRDGIRIVHVNNTFRRTRSFEETYRNQAIGDIASRLIQDFRPDVAHIHHLTGLSTTIVRELAARRIPCFVTLHDYWFLCHRGQLLDVDYRVCDGPGPSGCNACLGSAGSAGPLGFFGARAVRELDRRLPAGRRLRRLAERLYAVAADPQRADGEAGKRSAHMRQICAEVTHFVAPSRYMRDRFVTFGVAADRITVVENGVDAPGFRVQPRIPSERLRLGFVGSLMVSKAPHLALEAFGRLPRGTASLDIWGGFASYHGDDSYRDTLQLLLRQDGVVAHGSIAHDLVANALSSIDVVVVPSIWPENCPTVVNEARLAGVVVVASRIGGIPELVDDGRDGLLFRAGDATDLARVLARFINEPDLLGSLRARSRPVRSIEDDVRILRPLYKACVPLRVAAPPPRLAAVVLNFATPDDTLLAVKSLTASRRPFDDIIVVDNDSSDRLRDSLRDVRRPIGYIRRGGNAGFSGGMNVGIKEALARGADRVLLVNSDAIVPPDCVELLERCLESMPSAAIAGPMVLRRSQPDRVESSGISYHRASGRIRNREFGRRVALEDRTPDRVVDAVSGCVMLVKRDVFDAIGFLHEDYFFGFEDLDFCLKARAAGFATALAGSAVVYHEGGRSIGAASPRRLYFAARNHLLLARRTSQPGGALRDTGRTMSIVALNLAHAVISSGGSSPARLGAVLRGTRDYLVGRFGPDE